MVWPSSITVCCVIGNAWDEIVIRPVPYQPISLKIEYQTSGLALKCSPNQLRQLRRAGLITRITSYLSWIASIVSNFDGMPASSCARPYLTCGWSNCNVFCGLDQQIVRTFRQQRTLLEESATSSWFESSVHHEIYGWTLTSELSLSIRTWYDTCRYMTMSCRIMSH